LLLCEGRDTSAFKSVRKVNDRPVPAEGDDSPVDAPMDG